MEHFTRLNPSVFLYEPTSKPSSIEPDLIVLAGWMDAPMRNLAKYTAGYQKLYPSTRIVVITTSAFDTVARSNSSTVKRIAPVLDAICALPPDAKFLLAFFSNGGLYTTSMLARIYREKTGKPLPATAIILDSTPGRATYEATVRALSVGLPKNILLRFIGILVFRLLFGVYQLQCWIQQRDDFIEKARVDLNEKTLFDINTPRLYVYSEGDPMVDWRFVEEHSDEAQKLGYVVKKERYVESGHCMHLLLDQKRYWGAVTRLWSAVS